MAKVILLKNIPELGGAGEIKEVKEGYFRNFLMPRGLADLATPKKIKELESKRREREEESLKLKSETLAALEKLAQTQITFELKTSPEGHLYQGIGEKDLAEKLGELGFKTIRKEWILMPKPLKTAGIFEVEIKTPFREGVKVKVEIKPKS